jgi:hypothetical protein
MIIAEDILNPGRSSFRPSLPWGMVLTGQRRLHISRYLMSIAWIGSLFFTGTWKIRRYALKKKGIVSGFYMPWEFGEYFFQRDREL